MLMKASTTRLEGPAGEVVARFQDSSDAAADACFGSGWRKLKFLGLAAIFFTLGVLGVLLPGLPVTPFLLLTSYFLFRSSPRLNAKLLRSRLFGPILIDWQIHGGVRAHVRFKSILVVVIAVTLTVLLAGFSRWLTVAVVSLAMVGIAVILRG